MTPTKKSAHDIQAVNETNYLTLRMKKEFFQMILD